uniref:Uncharacterized protein n=1 Tax=Moniliophthora roreri TaxID=221103 RepID=A0A0W0GDM5_MONRR
MDGSVGTNSESWRIRMRDILRLWQYTDQVTVPLSRAWYRKSRYGFLGTHHIKSIL